MIREESSIYSSPFIFCTITLLLINI